MDQSNFLTEEEIELILSYFHLVHNNHMDDSSNLRYAHGYDTQDHYYLEIWAERGRDRSTKHCWARRDGRVMDYILRPLETELLARELNQLDKEDFDEAKKFLTSLALKN